ncbi:hypothetical protein D3C87_1925600 [compost metagenome]
MKTLIVTEVCGPSTTVEASNDYQAVAEVAGCAQNDVPVPIWEETVRGGLPRGKRCYMPLDNTGRQWIVEDTKEES